MRPRVADLPGNGRPDDVALRAVLVSGLRAADPARPAIVQGGEALSYGELLARSEEFAGNLAGGSGPVLIREPRGLASLTAMVGCVLADRPFFPLAPDSPVEATGIGDVPTGCGYLLTTSGTSGPPKLVLGSGRALGRYLSWQRDELALDVTDILSNTADPWFDFSFKETLGALVAGATILVTPTAALSGGRPLLDWLAEHRPTTVCLLPTRLAGLVAAMDRAEPGSVRSAVARLRRLLVSGEPFPAHLLRRWRVHAPDPVVLNLYGPTEATVIKLRHTLPAAAEVHTATVPVGTPIPGTTVEFVPVDGIDDARELCLVTDDLALGYRTPAGGATRFEHDGSGRRRLRTGDLATLDPDGNIVLAGRLDNVVKRRGVKVSLPAIEAAALGVRLVDTAAAVATPDGRIILFCGSCAGPDRLPLRTIRLALLDKLGPDQLPDQVRVLGELPLDARAKVDRAALRAGETFGERGRS